MNENLEDVVVLHGSNMEWVPSPNPFVQRKRLELHGPAEAGRVTSIVRYLEDSTFHAHDHPEGEEIYVISGLFEDEHGSYPAGSFLLNPEGFRHKPFSRGGCDLFVKLRQYPGSDRSHVSINTADASLWRPIQCVQNLELCPLYNSEVHNEQISLLRSSGKAFTPLHQLYTLKNDAALAVERIIFEVFVIRGHCNIGGQELLAESWIRAPWQSVVGWDLHLPSLDTQLYLRIGNRNILLPQESLR